MKCEKSWMELGWPIFTIEKETNVCAAHKKSRMELRNSILTVKSVSKVCVMHKNRRIEPKFEKNDGGEYV